MPEDKDFIDRRVGNVSTIFGLAREDAITLILVISLLCNVWLGREVIIANKDWSKIVVEEVRKQAPRIIEEKVEEKLMPMRDAVDSSTNSINRFIDRRSGGEVQKEE